MAGLIPALTAFWIFVFIFIIIAGALLGTSRTGYCWNGFDYYACYRRDSYFVASMVFWGLTGLFFLLAVAASIYACVTQSEQVDDEERLRRQQYNKEVVGDAPMQQQPMEPMQSMLPMPPTQLPATRQV